MRKYQTPLSHAARFFSIFVFILRLSATADDSVQIIEHTKNRIRICIKAELPQIEKQELNGTVFSSCVVTDWPFCGSIDGFQMPYKPVLLHLSGREAVLNILSFSSEKITNYNPLPYQDIAQGMEHNDRAPAVPETGVMPLQVARLCYLGEYKGNFLWNAETFPYQYDADKKELIIHRELVFEVVTRPLAGNPVPQEESDFLKNIVAISASRTKQAQTPPLFKSVQQSGQKWKFFIEKDGLYHITGQDLARAGVRLIDIDVNTIQLTHDGSDVPVYIHGWQDGKFESSDYLEFWGEYNRQGMQKNSADLYQDPYSKINVYLLCWDTAKGHWMIEQGQSAVANPQQTFTFYQTVHIEKDNFYERLNLVPLDSVRDHWFFDAGIGAGTKDDYIFELWSPDDRAPLGISVRIMLGARTSIDTLKHDVTVYLNDSYLATSQWYGQEFCDINVIAPENVTGSDLKNGNNTITIINNAPTNQYDFIMLNWFEITYPCLYRAHNDMLKFSIPPREQNGYFSFQIDGFQHSTIDIYKLGHSKILGAAVEQIQDQDGKNFYQVSFTDQCSSRDTEYLAIAESAKLKPSKILQDVPSHLKSSDATADYMIISHSRFFNLPILEELAQFRQSQGYHVIKIDVQDIYDEFNYGKSSPHAIKQMLQWAVQNWKEPRLKYVLLVGDGCYQQSRYSQAGDSVETLDLIPVFMRQTYQFGATASDHWYTLLQGNDEVPDIAIGRLPVRYPEDLQPVIKKIIRYETELPKTAWCNRLLFIGGEGGAFRPLIEDLAYRVPPEFEVQKLFTVKAQGTTPDPFFGNTQNLLDDFSNGCAVMSFHGHGGGAIWADNGLLTLETVADIRTQGRFPFILSMTCFTGAFESPSNESLADALLFSGEDGTMAFFGASGTGWRDNNKYYQNEIMRSLYSHPDQTIGDIVAAGKISYLSKYYGSYTVVSQINQYHLLGDPATRLVIPKTQAAIQIDHPILQKQDEVKVTTTCPFQRGTGYFDIVNPDQITHLRREIEIDQYLAETTMKIPDDYQTNSGLIRFLGLNDLGGEPIHGAVAFSLQNVCFDSVRVTPSKKDTLIFSVYVHHREPLHAVNCLVGGDTLSMALLIDNWYSTGRNFGSSWYGYDLPFYFQTNTQNGQIVTSSKYTHYIPYGIDLGIDENSIRFNGIDSVCIEAQITNHGDIEATDFPIAFSYYSEKELAWREIGRKRMTLPPYVSKIIQIPFSCPPGQIQIQIALDPDRILHETVIENNKIIKTLPVTRFTCSPAGGFLLGESITDTLRYDNRLKLFLPPGAVPQPCVLSVESMQNITIHEQPDFQPVPGLPAFSLQIPNLNAFSKPLHVTLTPAEYTLFKDSLNSDLYQFVKKNRKWVRLFGAVSKYGLEGDLDRPGSIAVLTGTDTQPPTATLYVDSQPHVPGIYCNTKPQFAVNIQDANGINISGGNLLVQLDGTQLDSSEFSLPDSTGNGNEIIVEFAPELSAGEHSLMFSACDCYGNKMPVLEWIFKVSPYFEVQMLGNYPNPFVRNTVFCYIVTRPCEEIVLKLYTASGHMIRQINPGEMSEDANPFGADYHEITWDGTDQEGFEVANGVYFYKLNASSAGHLKQITGKIAKIR